MISAAAVLVVLHRLIAWWGVCSPRFERLVTGRERVLVDAGVKDAAAMRAALINEGDLREAMRKQFDDDALDRLERAVPERDGELSLRRKAPSGRAARQRTFRTRRAAPVELRAGTPRVERRRRRSPSGAASATDRL